MATPNRKPAAGQGTRADPQPAHHLVEVHEPDQTRLFDPSAVSKISVGCVVGSGRRRVTPDDVAAASIPPVSAAGPIGLFGSEESVDR
jgi:hypothetical protein